jgi:hypothetical protein
VSQLKAIVEEFKRMRENGLETKQALNTLRPYIEKLPHHEREELAQMLRSRGEQNATAPAPTIKPLIKPLSAAQETPKAPAFQSGTIPADLHDAPLQQVPTEQIVWVNCPNCNKTNQQHEVFCYACGHLLEPVKGANDTRILADNNKAALDSEFFGSESVLVLRLRGTTDTIELRPQNTAHEVMIGRQADGGVMAPDVDLSERQAADLGVSRLHLSVQFNPDHNTLLVADLGSANGSFLNGQRMMPKELRVLRHGDELRLGKLVLLVSYRHPGRS